MPNPPLGRMGPHGSHEDLWFGIYIYVSPIRSLEIRLVFNNPKIVRTILKIVRTILEQIVRTISEIVRTISGNLGCRSRDWFDWICLELLCYLVFMRPEHRYGSGSGRKSILGHPSKTKFYIKKCVYIYNTIQKNQPCIHGWKLCIWPRDLPVINPHHSFAWITQGPVMCAAHRTDNKCTPALPSPARIQAPIRMHNSWMLGRFSWIS